MKTIACMQPYIFPYIGYFQLFAAADVFIYHDDIQYIKGGWINRNRILCQGQPIYFTLPVTKGSASSLIMERVFADNRSKAFAKVLSQIRQNYLRAPQFSQVYPLLEELFETEEESVSGFAQCSNRRILDYLGIEVETKRSSELEFDKALTGQDRVIALVKSLGGRAYVNAIGGLELYDSESFAASDIELRFLKSQSEPYAQLTGEFIPGLSIIDHLMFCPVEEIREQLHQFELIRREEGQCSPPDAGFQGARESNEPIDSRGEMPHYDAHQG